MDSCPKCGSQKIIEITSTYPPVYKCEECGFVFSGGKNPFIDE